MKEEMKIVGRRKPPSGGIDAAANLLELAVELRKGKPFIPRGVWRFKSFDEKDAWTTRMLARPYGGSNVAGKQQRTERLST